MSRDASESPAGRFPFPVDLLEDEPEREAGMSPFALLNVLLRRLRLVVGLPVATFVVVTGLTVLMEERGYLAVAQFLPANTPTITQPSGGGLVAQLSELVGGRGSGGPGAGFYAALVQSSPLLRAAAGTEYEFVIEEESPDTVRGSIARIFGAEPATSDLDLRISRGLLGEMVTSTIDPNTGFVQVHTTAPWPGLAVAVNERVLELINEFNVEQRQTQAGTERRFIEERLAEAERALIEAEDSMRAFMESNVSYGESPRLRFEAQRRERAVQFRQQIYSTLASSYEQARISEVRNTPAITIVERPTETVGRDSSRPPYYNGFFGFVIALLLALGWVVAGAYFSRKSEEDVDGYAEFQRLARAAVPELLPRPIRRHVAARFSPRSAQPQPSEDHARAEDLAHRRGEPAERTPEPAEPR